MANDQTQYNTYLYLLCNLGLWMFCDGSNLRAFRILPIPDCVFLTRSSKVFSSHPDQIVANSFILGNRLFGIRLAIM